ncbi:MAG: aminodeoxychorismate/anthranilate synthase component II [Pirellulales bacterium]
MILLIDNYDSFVHNLARYFRRLGVETVVRRNDSLSVGEVRAMQPQAVVLSPGPCTPREAGISLSLVRDLHLEVPMLGVCLGHQTIAEALGGHVVRGEPVHGRSSLVTHDESGLFEGLSNPLRVGRYHSLIVERATLPSRLMPTAHTSDGVMMAFAHRDLPVFGVQFHPESVLTEYGYRLLANFLRLASINISGVLAELEAEDVPASAVPLPLSPTVTPHAWGSA